MKKKRHLQDLILRVLEHMGERLYVPSTVMIFHGVEKQQMYLLQAVLQPFLPLPPPDGGKRGLQFYFMQFKCHLRPYIQYSCLVTNLWRQRKHWSAPYFLIYGLNDCLQASHCL